MEAAPERRGDVTIQVTWDDAHPRDGVRLRGSSGREGPLPSPSCASPQPPLLSVDRGHLVQAVFLGFEPQVGDAVGHVHSLGRVGVGAGGRVGGHGAERQEEEKRGEKVTSPEADSELKLSVSCSCGNMWSNTKGITEEFKLNLSKDPHRNLSSVFAHFNLTVH